MLNYEIRECVLFDKLKMDEACMKEFPANTFTYRRQCVRFVYENGTFER